jgi:uncharacterized membrane protein YbaN (DUF454 family)
MAMVCRVQPSRRSSHYCMTLVPQSLKRRLFVAAGTVALGLSVVGVIVPVLPTTPFLLLAAFCYMRGSQRLYAALLRNRFVGSYLRDYLEGRGMPRKKKIWTLAMLWCAMVLTAVLATDSLAVRVVLAVILAAVTVHILRIRTGQRRQSPSITD